MKTFFKASIKLKNSKIHLYNGESFIDSTNCCYEIISVIPLVTLPTSIMLWRSCDTFMYNYIRLWGADIANISISLNIYAA